MHKGAKVEIRGEPKTVNLAAILNGNQLAGPLEVWIAAIVASMDAAQKAKFAVAFENCMRQRDMQRIRVARVVADIPMPTLGE